MTPMETGIGKRQKSQSVATEDAIKSAHSAGTRNRFDLIVCLPRQPIHFRVLRRNSSDGSSDLPISSSGRSGEKTAEQIYLCPNYSVPATSTTISYRSRNGHVVPTVGNQCHKHFNGV
jgi:hypothetical protein